MKWQISKIFLACLFVAQLAAAQTATLSYVSEASDSIGLGESETYTEADGPFTASRNFDNGVTVNFNHATESGVWWDLSFAAPFEAELTAGFYPVATRFPFQASDEPGLSFSGSGRGCNTLTGEFTVTQVTFDYFGVPRWFSAILEQHCEGVVPALNASITYADGSQGPLTATAGNLLVVHDNLLHEFMTDGTLIQSIPILNGGGSPSTEDARDAVIDAKGNLHVFNGTFDPVLSSMTSYSGGWRHDTFTDWGIVNNTSYGGIGTFGQYVFVTDQLTTAGLVRFDTNGYSGQQFAEGESYIDLNVGLDGLLYALRSDENTVDVFNPTTLAAVRTVVLDDDVRGIAVNASGDFFGASWDASIYHFDTVGTTQASVNPGVGSLTDIDLDENGLVVAGSRFDDVVVTSESLAATSTFAAGSGNNSTFVAIIGTSVTPPVFYDGFETENTTAWSATVQ